MGRFLWILLLCGAIVAPAFAVQEAKRVTVGELDQLLAGSHRERDGKLAKELDELELTERVSVTRLARWENEFHGKHTREALRELADAAEFLDLPAAELPEGPPPSLGSQQQMIVRTVEYVNKTLTKLPDFYAVRTTTHFEDEPALIADRQSRCLASQLIASCETIGVYAALAAPQGYSPLQSAGKSHVTVTYRDGKELENARPAKDASEWRRPLGLVTSGEFGPILSVVLSDAIHSTMQWGHWEERGEGRLAVFRYEIPAENSHYVVKVPTASGEDTLKPAYHGEISVAPDSGAIYRITIVGDLEGSHKGMETSMMVQYGSVGIGGATYICPVRGVALSRVPEPWRNSSHAGKTLILTRLNDITFTGYHLFRAELKILPEGGQATPRTAH